MDPSKGSIFKTYDKPKGYSASNSFATFMIIGPTCFFLGMLFSSFPYDYPLLWTSTETPAAYYDQLETHLKFLHASPPIIPRILHIAISVGLSAFFIKLFKPSEANLLFDGASLVLYVVGIIVYITNIVKGLRIVTLGVYGVPEGDTDIVIGREDSLRVLAASNTILALVLIGVLVLQAGQWYAERKDQDEAAKFEKEQEEKKDAKTQKSGGHVTRSASKKKQ
ncbi:Shr3 amino acid permease chaperone [Hyaloscypha hepaticicola]|uniref:Shr3 amino acid permease chaperone n=1 Tax=Hyaloscypha hepaticicola TaxID=2082293 RepID=A0A2J6QFP6_9HELO|nr:Shr3 amino acid permease chaperone [Hyaloscypha hepaticicola]